MCCYSDVLISFLFFFSFLSFSLSLIFTSTCSCFHLTHCFHNHVSNNMNEQMNSKQHQWCIINFPIACTLLFFIMFHASMYCFVNDYQAYSKQFNQWALEHVHLRRTVGKKWREFGAWVRIIKVGREACQVQDRQLSSPWSCVVHLLLRQQHATWALMPTVDMQNNNKKKWKMKAWKCAKLNG